ncbi:MAG: hypothetical protein ACRBF0_16380 [Calditrichia bacterium]
MKQYFAFSRVDNSFIVSADNKQDLEKKVDAIRARHPEYYETHLRSGYSIVQANSIAAAKKAEKKLSYDLPLFKQSDRKYQVFLFNGEEMQLEKTVDSLTDALAVFNENPESAGEIVSLTDSGEPLKTYSMSEIQRELDILHREMIRRRKQLDLF